MEFDIIFAPPRATAQEKKYARRNGAVYVYESEQAKEAKRILRMVLAPHTPREPYTGTVAIDVMWRFPYLSLIHI